MAYKSCAAQIAANIAQDCNRPLVGGYTGRAVIIPANDFAKADVVVDANNPRQIMSIVLPIDGSVMAYTIDNVFATPFRGSNTAGNNESGRNGYLKTISVRVPMRGADVSRDVIEPLVKDADGFVVIAEKRDKVGDGSYEVIGYQNALRGDIAGVTRDESANGGDWIVPLTTVEKWADVTLVGAAETYESAKKEFEGLLGFDINIIRFVFVEGQNQVMLSANGLVIIESMQGGEVVRETYSALHNTFVTINADAGTEIVIYGPVTVFINHPALSINTFTRIDTSKNTALTHLQCAGCTGLTSLDVSKNIALTYLSCCECQNLLVLNITNTALLEGETILDQSMANLTTLQVAGTSAWAYTQVESWLSDFAPDRGMIYVDENTPQAVITAAEAKDWRLFIKHNGIAYDGQT